MTIRVRNESTVTLFTPTTDITGLSSPYYGLWNGNRFWLGDNLTLEDENGDTITQLDNSANVTIQAQQLRMDFPEGDFEDDCIKDIVEAGFNRTLMLSMHSGNPGSNGTNNELSGSGYSRTSLPSSTWEFVVI